MPAPGVAVVAAVAREWRVAPPLLSRMISEDPDWRDWYGRQLEMWQLEATHTPKKK